MAGVNGEYAKIVQILGEDGNPVADSDPYPRSDMKFEIHRYYSQGSIWDALWIFFLAGKTYKL